MSKDKGFKLRFGVGDPNGLRSSIWSIWTSSEHKADVYLAARQSAHSFKISLHGSGRWQISFTEQYYKKAYQEISKRQPSRHLFRWLRPHEHDPGLTLAFRIFIPVSELRVDTYSINEHKPVIWMSPPPNGHISHFALCFSSHVPEDDEKVLCEIENIIVLGRHQLSNGQALWVLYSELLDDTVLQSIILDARQNLKAEASARVSARLFEIQPGYRCFIGGMEEDGVGFMYDFAADTILGDGR